MKNINYLLLLISCLLIFSCSKETKEDSKKVSKNIPQNVSVPKKSKKSNMDTTKLNSVCNCYKEALSTLDEILDVRSNYESFEEYSKDTESVNKVKTYLKQWREIQSYCLQTYKRAMYSENDCYPNTAISW